MRPRWSLLAAFLVMIPSAALAAWPVSGIVVADPFYYYFQGRVFVVPDGSGGVIATMSPWNLASRVDPEGGILWSVDPFDAAGLPAPSIKVFISRANTGDGSGGMWLATQDADRTGNVVAVRYDASGALQAGRATLSEGDGVDRWIRAAISDDQGGMFVVWSTLLAATNEGELRATHVDALGNVTGPANGVVVFSGLEGWAFAGAVADGAGGLLVSTTDAGGAVVQRLDATLSPGFGAGVRIEPAQLSSSFALGAAGDGGAFVTWADGPIAATAIRVLRLDAHGLVSPGWPAAGAVAAGPSQSPAISQVVADGTGGACVSWFDQQASGGDAVYTVRASRVLANGRIAHGWQPSGVELASGSYPALTLVADGTGGCYLAWAFPSVLYGGVFAQHLAADGRVFPGWQTGGLGLKSGFGTYYDSPYAIADGSGGVYVGWDELSWPMALHQAHLTRLSPGGPAGGHAPTSFLSLARVAPNPATGLFTVSATMPDDQPARLEVFDLAGRVSEVREVRGAGERGLTLDASRLAPGVHWMRLTHPTGIRTARIIVVH